MCGGGFSRYGRTTYRAINCGAAKITRYARETARISPFSIESDDIDAACTGINSTARDRVERSLSLSQKDAGPGAHCLQAT